MRNWILLCTTALLSCGARCQTLAPVDISGFGKDRPIRAIVTQISSSECKGSNYVKGGVPQYDDASYDVHVSATVTFENRSRRPALLYKDFNPTMTERVAVSAKDIALGKYVTGFDGDRMAISGEPKQVSIEDFVVINPGETYTAPIRATLFASADLKKPLHTPGKYWMQLGIDARPDAFYFDAGAEKNSKRKWQSRGQLVDFILTEPFPIDITLDPNAPACKQ